MRTDVFLRGLGLTPSQAAKASYPALDIAVRPVSSGGETVRAGDLFSGPAHDPNAFYDFSSSAPMSLTSPTYGGAAPSTGYVQQPAAAPAAPLQVSRGAFEDSPADAYGATFRSIAPGEPSPAGAAPSALPWGLILALGALLLGG
jgi:hypothetical protein